MFGPNVKTRIDQLVDFHHRESRFFDLYRELVDTFKVRFSLSADYEVVIVNGSGTLAIETIVYSFLGTFKLQGAEGNFRTRWESLLTNYGKLDNSKGMSFFCQLETSRSILQNFDNPFFVDCVSSFPYVSPPKDAQVWVTVTSKILGAAPVLGVVVFKKSILESFRDKSHYSYLNFLNLVEFGKFNQTPQTPPIPLYLDFLEKLKVFNVTECIDSINYRCDILTEILGKENFIGDTRCPVLTFNKDLIGDVASKYDIYGSHSASSPLRQIFVYAQDDQEFELLVKDLRK